MRYVGSVIPVVITDVDVYHSMEEGIDKGLCVVDDRVGWWK